jgi:hypothetical protein
MKTEHAVYYWEGPGTERSEVARFNRQSTALDYVRSASDLGGTWEIEERQANFTPAQAFTLVRFFTALERQIDRAAVENNTELVRGIARLAGRLHSRIFGGEMPAGLEDFGEGI